MRSFADRARPWGLAIGLATGLAMGLGMAQAAPPGATETDTRSIIEALMPQTQRASRNLLVRQKTEAAAAASAAEPSDAPPAAAIAAPAGPPPSLSLSIQFEPNSARVRPESGALLGTLVAAMQSPELKGARFVIEGHSDASGLQAQNLRLSQDRADEVRLYLVALGVHPSRLKAVGRGASQPANPADPLAAENRRVRVVTQE